MQYRIKELNGIFKGQSSQDGNTWRYETASYSTKAEVEKRLEEIVEIQNSKPIYHEWKPKLSFEDQVRKEFESWLQDYKVIQFDVNTPINWVTFDHTPQYLGLDNTTLTLTITLKPKQCKDNTKS